MYNKGMATQNARIDWIENKTAELLATAKRSGFFSDIIADAKEIQDEGFAWDVALAESCRYWCR